MSAHKGLRTCLITGKKSAPADFFRFTVQNGQLVFDTDKKQSGRGAYVVKDAAVLKKLLDQKIRGKICHFLKIKKVEVAETEIQRVL